jgi:hypothetical protein
VTLGRRRRALRRGAHAARPHAPRSSGWPRQPWREGASRTLAATTARSRGCRNAWLPRPRAAWWGCCEAGHRARRGDCRLTSTFGIALYRQLLEALCETF